MNSTKLQLTASSTPLQRLPYQSPLENFRIGKTRNGTTNRMRAVTYIRVSDSHQVDGYSLDAQDRYYVDYCQKMDWVPTFTYREEGVSARYEAIRKRPVFQQLLQHRVESRIPLLHCTFGCSIIIFMQITRFIDLSPSFSSMRYSFFFRCQLLSHLGQRLSQRFFWRT